MFTINELKKKVSPRLKRKFNSIRYETIPTLKKRFFRLFHPPKFPKNADGKVLIHLGCGDQNDKRYINVDSIPFSHVHFIHDVTRLGMFSDKFADLVYASHVLEHTPYEQLTETLGEWNRILKPCGILRLSVPDFEKILDIYKSENNSIEKIEGALMGGQHYKQNFHMSVFNKDYLTKILILSGFKKIQSWDPATVPFYSFNDWAIKKVHGKYPLGLNLEAIK